MAAKKALARRSHHASTDEPRFGALLNAFAADPARAHVVDELAARKSTARRSAFGANALKVRGKIFAMVVKGQLVVKLSRERVTELVSAKVGAAFDPGHGRIMKEWLAVSKPGAPWVEFAKEAYDHVSATSSTPRRSEAKRTARAPRTARTAQIERKKK